MVVVAPFNKQVYGSFYRKVLNYLSCGKALEAKTKQALLVRALSFEVVMSEEIKVHFTNYIGTKCVNGFKMNKETYCKLRGWDVPANEDPLEVGYLVEYPDSKPNHEQFRGYISWSPRAAFEAAYHDVDKGCSFGHAVELIKLGHRLTRKGWNGKGMYITLVSGENWAMDKHENTICEKRDWLGIKTVDDQFMPWVPSQSDVLAEDWIIL
ncbi:hypothetical protein F22_0059 [Escherichia phage vB_Eco_F22]|nr:hypothetical protein F22_0059 [Escherichia phage vB_Eco_F22]